MAVKKFIFNEKSCNYVGFSYFFAVLLIDNTAKWLYNYRKTAEYYPFYYTNHTIQKG